MSVHEYTDIVASFSTKLGTGLGRRLRTLFQAANNDTVTHVLNPIPSLH